jgi:hypothetical protein
VLAQLGRNKQACMTWRRTARSLAANDGDHARATRLSAELGCAGVVSP